jgi:hypothetical protein
MTARHTAKETTMTAHDLHETALTVSPDAAPTVHLEEVAVGTAVQDREPIATESTATESTAPLRRGGDPRALLVARLLAAAALLVTAVIHAKLAADIGLGGPLFGRGHLFAAQAALSGVLAVAMLTRDSRVWLVAFVLSVAGLSAILASVYLPIPAVGPFPAINEPVWLLNKAVCAFAEASVITLWVVRQIAPPTDSEPEDLSAPRPQDGQ